MKDIKQIKLISLAAIFSISVAACGAGSESLPENTAATIQDADGDGYADHNDAFKDDPNEWFDTDGDGVGDNSDAFPHDASETVDSDGDGFGDNRDAFPADPNEWKDINENGIGDNEDASQRPNTPPADGEFTPPSEEDGLCTANVEGINWDALLSEDCNLLSSYNLFADNSDPTTNANGNGFPYDMAVPLFTDYATKYRFIFTKDGQKAKYNENEILDFPIGTVLVKTFTMPEDTAMRDGKEVVIETRLLIHRESGWKALPYYWAPDSTDGKEAYKTSEGKKLAVETMHEGEVLDFTYVTPAPGQCIDCHQVIKSPGTEGKSNVFMPIGPKARNLNFTYEYASGAENQLTALVETGLLEELPKPIAEIEKLIRFQDHENVNKFTDEELGKAAYAYLDTNCAHCHRAGLTLSELGLENYNGKASPSALLLEYNRDKSIIPGSCKKPLANHDVEDRSELKEEYPGLLNFDIVPGKPEESFLLYRMHTLDSNARMAPVGRSTHHREGVELINAWIASLPQKTCS